MTLRNLIEAVERGEFITGVMQSHETVAYAAFSGSLDAALALHEALLPGCSWFINGAYRGDGPEADIEGNCISVTAGSDTPSRAWLIAILRAVEAEGQT